MVLRLASRDNIDGERFDVWAAVLTNKLQKFNNRIEQNTFNTEDEILNWLENRSRSRTYVNPLIETKGNINAYDFRNSDPNRIYSVYQCDHPNTTHEHGEDGLYDRCLYSLRIRKANETFMTFSTEKGERMKSSYKKIENPIEFTNVDIEIDYSADMRMINNEYLEGIIPIDVDPNDPQQVTYLNYVKAMHKSDISTIHEQDKEYSIVYAKGGHAYKWLDRFVQKLSFIERYLEFFAKGGNTYVNIEKEPEHDVMIKYIFDLLNGNRQDTLEDDALQLSIRNMVIDPYFYKGDIYQIRHNKTLLSWHKNYLYMIQKHGLLPSKQFADVVFTFTLADFFKQIHPKENLEIFIKNIEGFYGVPKNTNNDTIRVMGKNKYNDAPKFKRVTRSFQ